MRELGCISYSNPSDFSAALGSAFGTVFVAVFATVFVVAGSVLKKSAAEANFVSIVGTVA